MPPRLLPLFGTGITGARDPYPRLCFFMNSVTVLGLVRGARDAPLNAHVSLSRSLLGLVAAGWGETPARRRRIWPAPVLQDAAFSSKIAKKQAPTSVSSRQKVL